ncbi:hypothetical protein ACQ1Q5_03765 [Ornithobacterium rhinotracheale]
MKNLFLILISLFCLGVNAQHKNYFQVRKNGLNHQKKEVYLIFNSAKHEKKWSNQNLIFWIDGNQFIYNSKDLKAKKIHKKPSKNSIVNDKDLDELEFSVYKEAFKKEGLKLTPPRFVHNFLDIHILEKVSKNKWIDYYPITWIYSRK